MSFSSYTDRANDFITLLDTDAFYPDYLESARDLYEEPMRLFRDLVFQCPTTEDLLKEITKRTDSNRIQMLRIFRKFASPATSVEMLKRKRSIPDICRDFGHLFRPIDELRLVLQTREDVDETLAALLYEYKDRGKKGYELTERFFIWFRRRFGTILRIEGPERAGKDVMLDSALPEWTSSTPADFVIWSDRTPLAIGFARYDSDRGGAQEDDRVGGNKDKVSLLKAYNRRTGRDVKCIFLNDGPGLLLGSMWRDYVEIEESGQGIVLVVTLKMLNERLTSEWLSID